MNGLLERARRARLRALLISHLVNGDEIWRAYRSQRAVPSLRFRNGLVLHHGPGDAPVFLFFEIVANACYRRQIDPPRAGTTLVDIGANIGAFTLDCAVRYPTVRIEAYEPNPRAFDVLMQNITANRLEDRVRAYPEAVGRVSGAFELWGGRDSVVATGYPRPSEAGAPAERCPMVDLTVVAERAGGAIAVLKIDAEGAEADIVEGGSEVLRSVSQCVAEYHEDRVPGVVDRCRRAFEHAGFEFAVASSRRCGPLFHARRVD